jgi:two-component system, sensor histidine kinase
MAMADELGPIFRAWGYPLSEEAKLSGVLSRIRMRQYMLAGCALLLMALLGASVQLNRDLRISRREAEQANQAKSAFLANMSHEIRTPLNGVLGMNSLILASGLSPEQREWSQAVQSSGQSLLAVLNDILDLAKIEAGSFQLEEAPFCLTRVLEDCGRLFQGQAKLKGLALDWTFAPDLPAWVTSDATRLRQIVSNFLGNAVKFTEQGAVHMTVTTTPEGRVRIAIKDTGPGLTPEQQSRLFQRFVQADESTTRRFGGTGLGLAICRELAESLGGVVGVRSTPGQGSEFWMELRFKPAAEPAPEAPKEPVAVAAGLSGLRVLVAEDNAVNQRVIGNWLRKFDCSFHVVGNGQLAVDALRQSSFDLVLMDCHMPVLDGYQALEQIRQRPETARLPVIALTANAMAGERERGLSLGFDDYLTKPIDPKVLRSALERYRPAVAA